jgi:hypothetical protein
MIYPIWYRGVSNPSTSETWPKTNIAPLREWCPRGQGGASQPSYRYVSMRSCERRDTISPVHPRACRERWFLDDDGDCGDGSSPRVRRTRAAQWTVPRPSRFILARAGNADHRSGAGRQDSVQHIQIRENGGLRFRAWSRPCESVSLPAGGRNRPAARHIARAVFLEVAHRLG